MRKVRWLVLLGSALIFGVAVFCVYAAVRWLIAVSVDYGNVFVILLLSMVPYLLLWLISYFIAKKVLSSSTARKAEAMYLGVLLLAIQMIASMVSWDPFVYSSLFVIALAVLIAYKTTVPTSETTLQLLVRPTNKKMSLWITILLILAALLVVPGYALSGIPGSNSDPWGLGMIILVPFVVLAIGITLIVQYVLKSPRAALVIAIVINVLLGALLLLG